MDVTVGTRQWGSVVAKKFIQRIAVLMAAAKFTDLFSIRMLHLHPLRGDQKGLYAITLHERWRIILVHEEEDEIVSVQEVNRHYGD